MLSLNELQNRPERLAFTDPVLEHSTTIESLLNVIYRYQLPPLQRKISILYLLDLADKWDVPVVFEVVRKHLQAAFHTIAYGQFDLFLIAIKLKDYALAAAFIPHHKPHGWNSDDWLSDIAYGSQVHPPQVYDRRPSGWIDEDGTEPMLWHIESCDYSYFIQLPPRVAWALHKATAMWDHGLFDGYWIDDWDTERIERRKKSIAESFRRIMDPKCA